MLVDIEFDQSKLNDSRKFYFSKYSDMDINNILPRTVSEFYNRLDVGIYETDLNFNFVITYFSNEQIHEQYYSFSDKDNFGICDNYEQIINNYPELNVENRKFIVSMTKIRKSDEPMSGGWRWHKWGEYIGIQNPIREYIYDEPVIEEVYVYHIYELE